MIVPVATSNEVYFTTRKPYSYLSVRKRLILNEFHEILIPYGTLFTADCRVQYQYLDIAYS